MAELSDKKILESWQQNASSWIEAIETCQIESRKLVTNAAIIDVVRKLPVKSILDIGCGEGWLARELSQAGLRCMGVDAVETLVNRAAEHGVGDFKVLEYENISAATIADNYDAAICNFSLIGKESVEHLFKQIPTILKPNGYLVVQTLHPAASCGNEAYIDGWREGSWQGFSDKFTNPAPWYFRTIDSWKSLFLENKFTLELASEPAHPKTGNKLSMIFVGKK